MLPGRIRLEFAGEQGRESVQVGNAMKELNADLKTQLAAVEAQIPPGLAVDAQGIYGKIMGAIARDPTPKQRKDMGTVGELIWNIGRAGALNWLPAQGQAGAGGTSMTYTVTQPRRGGNMEM